MGTQERGDAGRSHRGSIWGVWCRTAWRSARLRTVGLVSAAGSILALAGGGALAGTMTVTWDAVSATDLAGYHVYWGTTPGSHSNTQDVGNVTSATLTGLTDCTKWYVTVRAYDTAGVESSSDSNQVIGWPRPVVSTVTPAQIHQGETLSFTVAGNDFDSGDNADPNHPRAAVVLSGAGLTVQSYSVDACGTLHMTVQAASTAALGFSSVTVKNPDVTYTDVNAHPWPFGTLDSAIQVLAANDTTPPNPVTGFTATGGDAQVTLRWNHSSSSDQKGTKIQFRTDRTPTGPADGQTACSKTGAPSAADSCVHGGLSNGTTYFYAAFAYDAVPNYAAGVSASAQPAGAADTTPPTVQSTNPSDGQTGSAVSVQPTVTFSEALAAASVTAATVHLLDASNATVAQAAGSPSLSGNVVTIRPAAPLNPGAKYRVECKGGSSGVKDLAGNALAADYRHATGFTIATDSGSPGPPTVSAWAPSAAQSGIDIGLQEIRVTFDKDMSPLWQALTVPALQKSFAVIDAQNRRQRQTADSPLTTNGGKTVVIRLSQPLSAGASYATVVTLTGQPLKKKLEKLGIGNLWVGNPLHTAVPWTLQDPLRLASFRETAGGDAAGNLTLAQHGLPPENTDVPVNAEFRLTFVKTVDPQSVNQATFSLFQVSPKKKKVKLTGDPVVINNVVTLTAATPLDPGAGYQIKVKPGKLGALLVVPFGSAPTDLGHAIVVPFMTAVSAAPQSQSLGVGP